jgi:hypothetical protein
MAAKTHYARLEDSNIAFLLTGRGVIDSVPLLVATARTRLEP